MKKVLFTRLLSEADLRLCEHLHIEPICIPLIAIESVSVDDVLEANPSFWSDLKASTAVTFTSRHAVKALLGGEADGDARGAEVALRLLETLRRMPVYTVGEITADTLDEFGIMARFPEDYNGTVLAEMMLNDGVHTRVMHFCGSLRRPEFKDRMLDAGVEVVQVEVYRKTDANVDVGLVKQTLQTADAVVFYSPSAVEAYWRAGFHEQASLPFYAIGQTTLSALESKAVTARVPRIPTSELIIREIAKTI